MKIPVTSPAACDAQGGAPDAEPCWEAAAGRQPAREQASGCSIDISTWSATEWPVAIAAATPQRKTACVPSLAACGAQPRARSLAASVLPVPVTLLRTYEAYRHCRRTDSRGAREIGLQNSSGRSHSRRSSGAQSKWATRGIR